MLINLFRALFAPPRDLILLLVAGWLGLWLADRRARSSSIGEQAFDAVVFAMAIAFVAGGRVLFLAAHWSAFAASPLSLFSLNRDLFDAWGGLVAAAIVAAIFIQRRRLPALATLDLMVPLFAALSVGLALSHVASGAAFGSEAHLPWSIQLWGAERHPTQIYELLAAIAVLCTTWFWQPSRKAGSQFLLWLVLAAASRVLIEGFRGDSTLVLGGLRVAQLVAWVVLAGALLGLEWLQVRHDDGHDAPVFPANP
jgi:phosphatidylglycerol---prolipoprotein diacylglyceryl transferase